LLVKFLKKLAVLIPMVFGISLISFFIIHLAPGDPTALFVDPNIDPKELLRIKANWGLDKPIIIQFFYWLKNIIRGDFGIAYLYNRPVLELILERIPATLLLMGTAFIIILLISIFFGVYSAYKKDSFLDKIVSILSFIGMSLPSFWVGLMLILIFSVELNILPSSGFSNPLLSTSPIYLRIYDIFLHLILPVSTMVIVGFAGLTRYIRSTTIEVLKQNYIRTARAKGLPENIVLFKHALRNSLLPLITIVGMSLPDLFAGAFIIETIFGWPGMGRLGVSAVFSRNYPLIMGIVFISSVLILLGNAFADLLYLIADPRIRIDEND